MINVSMSAQNVLEQLAGCALPQWSEINSQRRVLTLRAGETLFNAGESQAAIFVVNSGVLKMIYETSSGQSWVKAFADAGVCFASITALSPGGVTSFSTRAVTESVVERIAYAPVQLLAQQHIAWQRAISRAFEFYGHRKEKREMELLTLSAEERYLRFLLEYPQLASVLSQKDIASYIRITPVALSRIKARLS